MGMNSVENNRAGKGDKKRDRGSARWSERPH